MHGITGSSQVHYEQLVEDGQSSIQYLQKRSWEKWSTSELEELESIIVALDALICSHHQRSKSIT